MKNFTPSGRLLMLAVFLLSAVGLRAQIVCGINGPVTISAEAACQSGFPSPQPYVIIDLGPGSGLINGPVNVTFQPVYNNIFPGPEVEAIGVMANNGFIAFETPENAVFAAFNIKIRLIAITIIGSCTQNFQINTIESASFSMQEQSRVQSITKNTTRSINPPCPGIATGRISANLVPTSGPFTATRFSAEIYPDNAFIQVFGPSSGPNNDPNSYLIETTAALEAGSYDIVISDNQSTTGCVVVYNTSVGDPSTTLTAEAVTQDASCFGRSDGSISVGVSSNIDPLVNGTIFVSYKFNNGPLLQAGPLSVSNNEYQNFLIDDLVQGSYTVTLTSSATGCNDDVTVAVSEPAEIEVTANAEPVCADAGTFDFTLSGVSGLSPSAQYRLIDASFFDPSVQNNGCWTRPSSGRNPIAPGLQTDGSYLFTNVLAQTPDCYSVNQDTLITLYLELRNPNGCRDTFSFPLQINAKPITPAVDATANVVGNSINEPYCSGQDIDLDIADYDPTFTYEISYTGVTNVVAGGAAAANEAFTYVDGSTVVSFTNNTDLDATVNFEVTKTDAATGCTSAAGSFSVRVRPEPTVDPILNDEVVVCAAEQFVSDLIEVNGSSNGNITYNFEWTLNSSSSDFTFTGPFTGNNDSNTSVSGTFSNTSGSDQTATLTITPVFIQQNTVVGGGLVDNSCEGESVTIDVTVTSRPTLIYDLAIGSLDTMLSSGSVSAFEICNGQDFQLDNLTIIESNSGGLAKYVRYRVRGDARFLQINTNGTNFGPTDVQTTQFLPIDNFAIGQPNIQNNHPNDNAQVAEIILTPYFEDVQNGPGFPLCAGEPVRLFLTVNPTPPDLTSSQAETVCSDERIEYTIMGAAGNGSTLQTRITETNVFPGQTVGSFTVPEGADRIDNFRFTLTGANGGGTTTTGGTGGLGGQVTGTLDATELLPGDLVDIRKGLAGGANNRNGDGGDATILTVTRTGTVVYTFIAAGGGGAGSAENGRNGLSFTTNPAPAGGSQGQGPGGFGGTGSPTALGGSGNVNGGGGGGGWIGGNGGNSQSGQSGNGGASVRSTTTLAPASFAQKTGMQLANGQVEIFYTVVYDDILFNDVVVDFDADSLTNVGEAIVNGEVDTILFGQQFVNNTNNPQDVTYTLTPVTQANCGDMSTIEVVVTIEPVPMATIASGSTTTVSGNATDGYTATVCSGDSINAILNSLTMPSEAIGSLYFEVVTNTTAGTNIPGNATGAASNTPRFDVINTGLPIDFFERRVVNNTGVDGTIIYTITPYIGTNALNMLSMASSVDCEGDPITFTVTVQPGFDVEMNQPPVNVCSRDALSTSFDLDASQAGSINITFDQIRIEGFRVSDPSADFTFTGLDTTGLAAGGFLLNRTGNFFNNAVFTNRTGGGVGLEFDLVFISDTGCESRVVTYPFNIRPEPIIDESNTAITICEGEATGLSVMAATNSAFFNNFAPTDVTFSYTLDEGVMTHTGATYPVSGAGVGAFRFQSDAFDNPSSTPQTATYTVVATSRFGCASQPVTYTVTVEPSPELAVTASQGSTTINGEVLLADIETLTICSGSTVDFALSQDVTGTGVSYRIQRVVTGTITNGNGSAIDNFEGGLAVAGFQETLANTSTVSATVQYNLAAYTYGRNGMDDDGLNASDDCQGVTKRLIVEVLPATTDETSLSNNLTVNLPNVGNTNPGNGAQICDNSEVFIRPVTTIDPATGVGFIWSRENDGTLLGGATSGSGGFNTTQNANNVYPAPNADRIQQVLTAQDGQTTEVRYIVTLYSFGSDGVDDMLASGSDDCAGDIDTVTVQLDPTPVLTADLEIGTAPVVSLNAEGSTYTYEICSGEDFLLDNLAFPETADGKLKYIEFLAIGQINFLGLTAGPLGTFQTVAPIGNFSLGAQNVQNTEPNGNAQTAFLFVTPYFEDGNDETSLANEECAGETIQITVTINAAPPNLGPFTETVCSEERVEYQIPGASNQGFRSRVAGSTTFDASNDFVVPPGAARIFNVDFSLSGANGGATLSNRGGRGGVVEASINPLFPFLSSDPTLLYPGDTVRVRKSAAGASGVTNGSGGNATLLLIIAGPSPDQAVSEGSIVKTLLAGGGGGAGFAEAGADAGAEEGSAASDGGDGAGLGGFGGTGWNAMNPQAGSFGGAGRGNGGGGGGGWNGGDGGSNVNGLAGGFGTSYSGIPTMGQNVNAAFSAKQNSDATEGTVTMDYILVYDDVRFDLVSRNVGNGLINISDNPIVSGEVDTILFGERFDNPTDAPIDVVYTFSTSSEANCPGGEVVVTLTVEPTPTLDLASNGTMLTDNGDGTYAAEICSGDSLSAILSSMTIPSQGTNVVRVRVIDVTTSSIDVSFGTGDGGEASASLNLNGNDQPSTNDIPFYEASIDNVGATNGTVTYTVVPYIVNTVGSSGMECVGDTLTLTVTVYPEVITVTQGPIMNNVCSNGSLGDTGFDIDASQPMVQVSYDSIIIDTVRTTAAGNMNFDTVSSAYSGTPVTVLRSADFFNGDTYRNRTGGQVSVIYEVRLVSGPGCTSDPITYVFRYTAEPVIDIVESATNQIDTVICSGDMTGLVVVPAANSAFPGTGNTGPNSFQANIDLTFSINLPTGVTLTKANGSYPNTTGGRAFMRDDILTNNTAGPLDVIYTVKPVNGSCAGDSVNYTVTVNPNPFVDVMLTSLGSTETFGLGNSRLSVSPNPQFDVCSGQALTATVPSSSAVATGMLMVNFKVSVDANTISGYPLNTNYTFPASELADILSYAAGDLVNMTSGEQFFTVEYRAYIEANGIPGFQNDGVDCLSDGIIQFDVVVSPTAIARVDVRVTNDAVNTPIPTGMDTLCSGALFDLAVRQMSTTANDPNVAPIDSFIVKVDAPGLVAGAGTESSDFTVAAPFENPAFYFTRLDDLTFFNTTPGIKTVTYIVTPYTGACAGTPDTTTISFRAEIDLIANEPVLCSDPGVATSIFAIDANGGMLSTTAGEYRYQYIGGTSSGYSLSTSTGGNPRFVFDPLGQANTIVYTNQLSVTITPAPNAAAFTPGTVNFQVIYDDVANGCGVITDTITITFRTTADPGMASLGLGILCDEVNFILNDALLGEDEGGVFTYTNGNPGLGVLNGANFTPMVGGADPAPVAIDFTYTVGGGNSGCATASVDFSIMVEPEPNAGTYGGSIGEACQDDALFNLFSLLNNAMPGGDFVQTAGVDFLLVGADGVLDQTNVSPGTYEFSYEVMSANGCGSDIETGITVEILSRMDCSVVIPCDEIVLTAGFNVIAFDVLPNDRSVESIFATEIANNTLLTVIAIHPDEQASAQLYSFNPTFGTVSSGITALRPGFGYVVEVASDTQIETCGVAVDTSIRVALQSGLNIVGYTKPGTESIFDYFETLIDAGDVNLIRTVRNGALRQLRFNPNASGNLFTVANSTGYLLDIDAAYANGSWRDGTVMPTSNFDRLFGHTDLSGDMAGQSISFTDVEGNLYGRAQLRANGTYDNVMLYGDLTETTRRREGLEQGEEIFAEFQGERIATGITFSGNWNLRQIDLTFNTETETPLTLPVAEFAMKVFPNPTSGMVQVVLNLDQDYSSVRVELYGLLGQRLIERKLETVPAGETQMELDLHNLAAGTYWLRITTNEGVKGHAQLIRR